MPCDAVAGFPRGVRPVQSSHGVPTGRRAAACAFAWPRDAVRPLMRAAGPAAACRSWPKQDSRGPRATLRDWNLRGAICDADGNRVDGTKHGRMRPMTPQAAWPQVGR